MGARGVAVRLRIDARRPASWLALGAAAAVAGWLAAESPAWWLAAAVLAGAMTAVAAIGAPPRAGPDVGPGGFVAWAGLRAAWPAAGAIAAWFARGVDPRAVGTTAAMVVACGGTAAMVAVAHGAGLAPADAAGAALALAAVASAAALATAAAPWDVPAWSLAVAAGWWAAAVAASSRARRGPATAEPRPQGPLGGTVFRAVMASALVGMVACLFLVPHVAWGYAWLAAGWGLVAAVPRAALGPGAEGEAARRRLAATAATGRASSARVAARTIAAYAAVLAWPPLVAAALAGSGAAASEPLAIAAAIGAGACGLAAAAAGMLAVGSSRETALAVSLLTWLAVSAASAAFPARGGVGPGVVKQPSTPGGMMLRIPGDPARLPQPREEPRSPP